MTDMQGFYGDYYMTLIEVKGKLNTVTRPDAPVG